MLKSGTASLPQEGTGGDPKSLRFEEVRSAPPALEASDAALQR
jgi:hypothetical protein